MRCRELIKELNRLAPESMACDWDNPGLLAGRMDKEVKRVFLALDATDEAVEQAIVWGADLLLTHHPLIFRAVKKVNDQDLVGRRLVKLLQADICYYAMHTNFDAAPGCMADLAAERLGMIPEGPLEMMGEQDGTCYGIGKVGTLPAPMTLRELANLVKERFGLSFVTGYGAGRGETLVSRIAVSPGSGGSMIGFAREAGAQVLITGDIGHHPGIDAAADGLVILDAGHYGLEHIFTEFMEQYLAERFGGELEVLREDVKMPVCVM